MKSSKLPTLVECDHIPQDKHEIPTPQMARSFPHLQEIAEQVPLSILMLRFKF